MAATASSHFSAPVPATVRECRQAVAGVVESESEFVGRTRSELLDVEPDGLELSERRFRPNDLRQDFSGFGQGNSSGVPQDLSHAPTRSWVTN